MWPWLAALACAHPMGERFATQTTRLVVYADHVEVDYVAEVPNALIRTAGRDPMRAMATEIASGLLLEVDGSVVSMTRRGPPMQPQRSSEHTFAFALRLAAPLPTSASEVSISTANLLDASNFFAADVWVADGLLIRDCSLLQVEDGRITKDDTLRWRKGTEARELSVALAQAPPAWWRWVDPPSAGEVRAAKAIRPQGWSLLRWDVLTPGLWLGAMALALGVGSTSGRGSPHAALLLPVGAAMAGLPLGGPVDACLAVGVALTMLVSLRRPEALPWLVAGCIAALAAGTHSPRAAWLVAAAGLVGLGLGRPGPRVARGLSVAVVVALAARAWPQ